MGSAVEVDEPAGKALKRAAIGHLGKALARLEGRVGDSDPGEIVHDARKRLKKARAVVKVARGGLGRKFADRADGRLGDIGRAFGEVRDAAVLVETLSGLVDEQADPDLALAVASTLDRLRARERQARRRVFDDAGSLIGLARDLGAALEGVEGWDLGGGWSTLRPGVARIARRASAAFDGASSDPSPDNLHRWRRRVKDLRTMLGLLEPTRPRSIGPLREVAAELADLLGLDHDLAVLRGVVSPSGEVPLPSSLVDRVVEPLDARRIELRRRALELGRALHAEPPDALVDRLRAYWKAWKAEARAARLDPAPTAAEVAP